MRINEKLVGGVLYALGLIIPLLKPPVDGAACIFTLYIGLVITGSLLIAFGHPFKTAHERCGWLGVASGLGIAIIGLSGFRWIVLIGAVLATIGLLLYKLGG